MAREGPNPLIKPAVRMATAGICSVFAGPLGLATGAFIGGMLGHVLGEALGEFSKKTIESLTERASETFLHTHAESLVERLKESRPDLEGVYREALRLSLSQMDERFRPEFAGWFANWDICLSASVALQLDEIQPSQLTPDQFDERFRSAMQRLDAQGAAIAKKTNSIILYDRDGPELKPLLAAVKRHLPERFEDNLRELIVQPEQIAAWNQLELNFRDWLSSKVDRIDKRTESMDAKLDELLRRTAEDAEKDKRITRASL